MFCFTGVGAIIAAMTSFQLAEWLLAIYVPCVNAMAFASMLTVFSNAVDESSQGWVMGVSSAVMAAAWVISGLSSNLIGLLGTQGLIVLGGVLLIACSWILARSRFKSAGA